MKKHVLLSGCGNIGFRHLQALSAMTIPAVITVVEPNLAHHPRIRAQFEEAADGPHRFELLTELPGEPARFDLVVVATVAAVRRAVVEEILARHEAAVMLLEKVLFQTVADLDAIGALLAARDVATFVNCGRRTFPGYQRLRETLGGGVVDIEVTGDNFGLASNAVHFLDLAEFLNGATIAGVDAGQLEPGSRPGQRPGNVDLFGCLRATLSNGAKLAVTSADEQPIRISVVVRAADAVHTIDEIGRTIVDGSGTRAFASQNVSETTDIYEDALRTGTCVLTPYADSAGQHRHYLRAVQSHLGLPPGDDVVVPIS